MKTTWREFQTGIAQRLAQLEATDAEGKQIPPEEAFHIWRKMGGRLIPPRSVYVIGNGASSSMASHFAADITKNCGIRAAAFTDAALVTALANDNGYENIFAIALQRYAGHGDMLVAVSSSGESENILRACRKADALGMDVITISAKNETNPLRKMGCLNLYVPAETFGLAESAHAIILHYWTDCLEADGKEPS